MSWTAILALATGTYAMKAAGPVLLGGRHLPQRVERTVDLVPAALLAALVAVETLTQPWVTPPGQSLLRPMRSAPRSSRIK